MATNSTPKPKLSNNNFIIVAMLITLVTLGVTVLVGKSLVSTIIYNTKIIAMKNTAKNQLDANLKAAPKLVDAYTDLGDTKRIISAGLPNTSDFPGLMAQLENMAGVSGVVLKSVSPDSTSGVVTTAPGDIPQPQEYKFAVTMSGNYVSLQKFLTTIENSIRPMRATSFQIAGTGSNLTFSISLSTYYQNAATIPYKLGVAK